MPKIKYEGFESYPGVIEGQTPGEIIEDPIQYRPYRETYEALSGRLMQGYPIPDEVAISVMGNNTLLETSFRLRDLDKQPIETVDNPGKSAHVAHTDNVALATLTMLSRKGKREDHLYTVKPAQLREVGIIAVYAPTRKKLLHVRLVPESLDEDGDIPYHIRAGLVNLLQANEVPQEGRIRREF